MAIMRPGKHTASGSEIRESNVYSLRVVFSDGAGRREKIYPCKDLAEAEKAVDCFRSFSDVESAHILENGI